MSGHRKALRDAVRAAMSASPRFGAWTAPRSWSQGLDVDALPLWAVTAADEQSALGDKVTLRRDVRVTVTVRRAGGDDLEDILDADAAVAEPIVWPALDAVALLATLSETRIQIEGSGMKRIGQIDLVFTCLVLTETPV